MNTFSLTPLSQLPAAQPRDDFSTVAPDPSEIVFTPILSAEAMERLRAKHDAMTKEERQQRVLKALAQNHRTRIEARQAQIAANNDAGASPCHSDAITSNPDTQDALPGIWQDKQSATAGMGIMLLAAVVFWVVVGLVIWKASGK